MKIYLAGISTETNTFAAAPSGAGAWDIDRGQSPAGSGSLWREVIARLLAASDAEVVLGLLADAQPNGATVRAVYEGMRDELLAGLQAAMPVDAVILPLHGAMVAEGYPDCEGDLIERVRALVGPEVPIGVELDPHCHFTDKMRRHADLLIAYKEYPHTDVLERFEEVWHLTLATARRQIKPVTAVFDCRMTNFWHTTREPMKAFVQRMKDLEGRNGVLSVNFGHGFPYGDVPEAGAKVWVTTDNDAGLAARLAEQLGHEIFALRFATGSRQFSIDAALDRLQAAPAGEPFVLADIADNAGGGASSDSTFILRALVERGIGNVALGAFYDLGAVQVCRAAGVGARLALRVGGKLGPASGDPVDLNITVRAVVEAHSQSMLGFPAMPCGPAVWVSTDDGIDLVLISIRQQVFGTDIFAGLGIDLTAKRAIVVKSSQHFHAAFAPLASEVLYVESPGLLRSDFEAMPYQFRDRNYWPRLDNPWSPA